MQLAQLIQADSKCGLAVIQGLALHCALGQPSVSSPAPVSEFVRLLHDLTSVPRPPFLALCVIKCQPLMALDRTVSRFVLPDDENQTRAKRRDEVLKSAVQFVVAVSAPGMFRKAIPYYIDFD